MSERDGARLYDARDVDERGSAMAACGRCGADVGDGARFCPSCGAPVEGPADTTHEATPDTTHHTTPEATHDVGAVATPPRPGTRERAAQWGVDSEALRAAVRDTAVALGAQLAFLFVLAAFIGLALLPAGHHGDPVVWARTAVYAAGMSLRAALTMAESFGPGAVVGADYAVYAMPLLGTVSGLAAVARVARRREAAEPAPDRRALAGRAILTGAAYFVALGAIGVAARGRPPYGIDNGEVSVGLGLGSLLAGCLVLVGGAAAGGRLAAVARRNGHPTLPAALLDRAGSWAPAVRAAATTLLVTALGAALYLYVYGMVDGEGVGDRLRGTAVFLLLLPNLALLAGGVAMGATIGLGGYLSAGFGSSREQLGFGGGVGYGFLSGGIPGEYWPMLAIPVLAALVAGLRAAARAHPGGRGGWYKPGVVLASFWVAGALASQVRASSSADGSIFGGSGSLSTRGGLALTSLVLCAFAFGTLSWVAQRFVAPSVAAAFPRAFARLGGAALHEKWTAPPEDGATWRRDPRRARWLLLTSVAAVAVLTAAVASAAAYVSTLGNPERVARRYLDALARGDADGALAVSARGDTPRRGADLLTDEALGAQRAADPIRSFEILDSDVHGDEAEVDYRIHTGRQTFTGMLELRKRGGGLVPRWTVVDPGGWVTVEVPEGASGVRINGVVVAPQGDAAVARVFPGVVVATMPESGIYAADEARGYLTAPDEQTSLSLDAEISPAAVERIKAALDERARVCAAVKTVDVPDECPFGDAFVFGETTDVRWTIVTPPSRDAEVTLRYDGEIEVRGHMELVVTYRTKDFFDTPENGREEVDASYSASVTVTGETVTIDFEFVF